MGIELIGVGSILVPERFGRGNASGRIPRSGIKRIHPRSYIKDGMIGLLAVKK
jgi:hypothetical protein